MSTVIRDNERSYAIDLISHVNTITSMYDLQIKRAGGERTISVSKNTNDKIVRKSSGKYSANTAKRKVMFPDVVLYADTQKTKILQGWELKLPDTLITDETFIKDAQRKAVALGLNSYFIWNFTSGVLYIKNESGAFHIAKQWNNTKHITSRTDVEAYRTDWENEIKDIIIEINKFFVNGTLSGMTLGEIISDSVVAMIIERNKRIVSDTLKSYVASNSIAGAFIDIWWKETEKEYAGDESDKHTAYAKMIILNWTNRIIFAHLIKQYHNMASRVETISYQTSIEDANTIFIEITRNCDFYNIFSDIAYNTCLPPDTWSELMELNNFLQENGISEIEQTSLQTILESTVSTSKREFSGQFTTPSKLAEILTKLTIINRTEDCIDPCCGTGSIPKEIMLYKKDNIGIENAIKTTWASDKYEYPLQVANISLTTPESINVPCRIFKHNALNLQNCSSIEIVNPLDGKLFNVNIPKFGSLLSNLPFIPFEIIKEDDQVLLQSVMNEVEKTTQYQLSRKSDIYCFIIFALHNILKNSGRAGFITSNSWLGTSWGKTFFEALNCYFYVEQIHISGKERWFNNAQVVTVLLILTKKDAVAAPDKSDIIHFCKWNKSLDEISQNNEYRDCIVNSSLLKQELDKNVLALSDYNYGNIEKILNLNVSLNALFYNIEWLKNMNDSLIPLNEIFNIIRGERRGWDKMFYPESGHGIEKKFLKRVLINARKVESLCAYADSDAFCCGESTQELESSGMHGTISWIRKFENGVNGVGRPLPEVLARGNMYWYEMKDTSTADICTMMNPDKRLFFAKFDEPTFINQRLVGLRAKEQYPDIELYHALLNSIVGMFYIEAIGFGRGLGALDINKNSINSAFMLNPNKISKENRNNIVKTFKPLLNRNVKTTTEELEQTDRQEFNIAVLKTFGIEEYYQSIKESLLEMQRVRLSVR